MESFLESGRLPGILLQLNLAALLILLALAGYFLFQMGNDQVAKERRLRFGLEELRLALVLLLLLVLLGWVVRQRTLLLSLLTPFLIAGVLSYALNPAVHFLKGKGLSRTKAVAALFLTFLIFLLGLSISIFPMLGEEVARLGDMLPELSQEWYRRIAEWYETRMANQPLIPESLSGLLDFFDVELKSLTEWLLQSSGSLFQGIGLLASSLVSLVTIPVLTFYFMKDGEKIFLLAKKSIPPGIRSHAFPLFQAMDGVLSGFIRGQILVAVFVGFLSGMVLMLLGIDFWILLGLIAGITNIIPYLGPFIGAIPAVLVTLSTNPGRTLWVILAFVVIQQVESSLVSPKIVGNRVGLHPTLIIFSLLLGGALGGLVGLIIAVPLAAVLKVLVQALLSWLGRRYPRLYMEEDPASSGKEH